MRIMVARPKIHGNLGGQQADYWATRLQTELESKLRDAAARARRTKIEIVSAREDLDEILLQDDLRNAGVVKSTRSKSGGLTDRDVFIAGSVLINVREELVSRSVYRPRINGFSIGGVLGGAINHDDVCVPVRTTSVDATLEMVTNAGTRPVPFVTHEIKPVVTEGGTGGIRLPGARNETLPALDADIRVALDRVAPAFVDLLFPREQRQTVTVESCGKEECRACVDEFLADARDGIIEPETLHSVENLNARHGNCEDSRFCLAIAYELSGRYRDALDACEEAIRIKRISEPGTGCRQSDRDKYEANPYVMARKRLESRRRFEELRGELAHESRTARSEDRPATDSKRESNELAQRP